MSQSRPNGPIEDHDFPTEIEARVITPGLDPRLHGFSVEGDLALHYRFPELVLLALSGVAPDEDKGRAFDIALQFLAPLASSEAPTHAAILARICDGGTSSILSVASIALAERARHIVARQEELLKWLEAPLGELPPPCLARGGEDRASVDRLQKALAQAGVEVPGLALGPDRWTAIFMTLHFAGLRRPAQLETALVMASLAPTVAEAFCHTPAGLSEYPIQLPRYIYEEGP